jgi:hypothetical protein
MKPQTMRPKTKEELKKLANIMVDKYQIANIKGTNEFLEIAVHEAEENDLEINWQTVKLQGEFLEKACQYLEKQKAPKVKEEVWPDMPEIKNKFVVMATLHFNDGTTQDLYYPPQMDFKAEYVESVQKVPEYSMFVLGEDGLIVTKGSYKGKTIDEIDEVNFKGAKRGWAKWCLSNDKDLTDDDREVFNKILQNQL